MNTHVTHEHDHYCPACNAALNRATNADGSDAAPQEFDVSFCFTCGAILYFDARGRECLMTEAVYDLYSDATKMDIVGIQESLNEHITSRTKQ
jgi:hypothetical protein